MNVEERRSSDSDARIHVVGCAGFDGSRAEALTSTVLLVGRLLIIVLTLRKCSI